MVFTHANILARMHGCAALANNDVARDNTAAAALFYTQSASRGIASVDAEPAFLCAIIELLYVLMDCAVRN